MDPLHLLDHSRRLVAALAPYPTLDALCASPGGSELLAEANQLLATVRGHEAPDGGQPPGGEPHQVRIVHWNVEHGNRYGAVEGALAEHPRLAGADIISLNEVDLGMARSGNRDVAFELARRLGRHAVWTPLFLELSVGRGDDARFAAGLANREALFGMALLSRLPLGRAWRVPLPSPEAFHFRYERMLGRHCALAAEVLHPAGTFVAVTTHLEVHRRRLHRRLQAAALMRALEGVRRPVLLAGDFNSSTFERGNAWDSLSGLAVLALTPAQALQRRLRHPDLPPDRPREPLFLELQRAGFQWAPYNDFAPSLRLRFERLAEVEAMPDGLRRLVLAALAPLAGRALLRLDWIAARGFGAGSGYTVPGLDDGREQASDHAPITAELELPAPAA